MKPRLCSGPTAWPGRPAAETSAFHLVDYWVADAQTGKDRARLAREQGRAGRLNILANCVVDYQNNDRTDDGNQQAVQVKSCHTTGAKEGEQKVPPRPP